LSNPLSERSESKGSWSNVAPVRRRFDHLGIALTSCAILALGVRFTIRDRVPLIATFFYATPLAIIAGLLVASAVCSWRWRSLVPLAGALVIVLSMAWPVARTEAAEQGLRIVLWNVAHRGDSNRTREALAPMDADVAVLVETGRLHPDALDAWGWPAAIATDGMMVLAGTAVVQEGAIDAGANARARRFLVTSGETTLRLVVVDVRSHPFVSRRLALDAIRLDAVSIDGPLVVLGDFNTPPESAWFDAYRRAFVNAFEHSGRGWVATWPSPLPVLQVDHVWTRGLTPLRTERCSVSGFDHRAVVVELAPSR